jgi:hypothetical protein
MPAPSTHAWTGIVGVCLLLMPTASAAQDTPPEPGKVRTTLTWLAGGLTGLAIHESGHVVTAAALGAHPGLRSIKAGVVPFFAVTHDPVNRRREYAISAAGLWTQGASVEWMLYARPNLKNEHAPLLKGMFAFHLVTSAIYGAAGFAGVGPPERDTRGMALSIGRDGVPEGAIGALVLAPAALDIYRYWHPESRWATWASRGLKIAIVGLVISADRN